MSFPVATYEDTLAQIRADFTALPGADVTLRVGTIPVLAKILAKLSTSELLYLAALPNRALIPTKMQAPYLDYYCAGVGLTRLGAAPSAGSVSFTGNIAIPSGSQMQDSTGTVILQTTAIGTVSGNTVTAPVVTVSGGSAGNLAAGAPATLLVGIAGVQAVGNVLSPGLTGGTDAETDAALQVRLGERLSNPPQGGANADYVAWAKMVPGVTRVWVYPAQNGPGTVAVTFMMDGRANPIPLSADVAAVQAAINAVRPTTAGVTVFAPAPSAIAPTITGLTPASGYTLSAAQAAAAAAVANLNYTTTPGGYGWDGQAENYLTGGTAYREQVSAAISSAAGVGTFDLSVPASDVTVTYGNIIQFSAPTFS